MLWTTLLKQALKAAIPFIPEIIEAGKNYLQNIKSTPALNANSKVMDIEQINESICEMRDQVFSSSETIIRQASDTVMDFAEEQIQHLDEKSSLLTRHQISVESVENCLERIQNELKDFWEDALHRKISLDNPSCRSVLVLPPGEKKLVEMQRLTDEILSETMDEYVEKIQDALDGLYDSLEEDVENSVDKLEETVDEYTELVASIDVQNEERLENLMTASYEKAALYIGILERTGA